MFEIAENKLTYDDIKETKEEWYKINTMTQAQNDEWKKWTLEYLTKQKLAYNKTMATRNVAMLDLMYGLKISDLDLKPKTKKNDTRKTGTRKRTVSKKH